MEKNFVHEIEYETFAQGRRKIKIENNKETIDYREVEKYLRDNDLISIEYPLQLKKVETHQLEK